MRLGPAHPSWSELEFRGAGTHGTDAAIRAAAREVVLGLPSDPEFVSHMESKFPSPSESLPKSQLRQWRNGEDCGFYDENLGCYRRGVVIGKCPKSETAIKRFSQVRYLMQWVQIHQKRIGYAFPTKNPNFLRLC